jgi:transcriptional regulator with XRE-family HTH domain
MARPIVEITKHIIEQAEILSSRGLTMEQIADALGIGTSTLYEKQAENAELMEAIKSGRGKGLAEISNALYEGAKSGNTTAQIFYLKCRGKWREADTEQANSKDDIQEAKNVVDKLKGDEHGQSSSTES